MIDRLVVLAGALRSSSIQIVSLGVHFALATLGVHSTVKSGERHAKRTAGAEAPSGRDRQRCTYCQDRDRRRTRDNIEATSEAQERLGGCEGASGKHHGGSAPRDSGARSSGEVGVMSNHAPQRVVYKPTWVANSFLIKARKEGVNDIDPLKIQKLVYNLHGWHLAVTGHPVIGERFEAWPHGPVNSTIYHQFKNFKFRPITGFATDIDPTTGAPAATYVTPADEGFYDVFDRVWDRYKGFTGQQLSDLTHAIGTPWSYAREHDLQYIPDALIRNHFIDLTKAIA